MLRARHTGKQPGHATCLEKPQSLYTLYSLYKMPLPHPVSAGGGFIHRLYMQALSEESHCAFCILLLVRASREMSDRLVRPRKIQFSESKAQEKGKADIQDFADPGAGAAR